MVRRKLTCGWRNNCHAPHFGFVAKDLRKWLEQTGAKTIYIEPGSSWENDYCDSFNSGPFANSRN